MSDAFPDWDKPATKGDVIQMGVRTMKVATALGAVCARIMAGDKQGSLEEMEKYFLAMTALSETVDELSGRAEQ